MEPGPDNPSTPTSAGTEPNASAAAGGLGDGGVDDVTARDRIEAALRILSITEEGSGTDYFGALVAPLAALLDMDAAYLSVSIRGNPPRARTLAWSLAGERQPDCEYPIDPNGETNGGPIGGPHGVTPPPALQGQGFPTWVAIDLLDPQGQPMGRIGVATRRALADPAPVVALLRLFAVRATAEIRRTREERRFHAFFDFAPDAMVLTDLEGRIRLVNQRATTLFGYRAEELIGQPVEILLPQVPEIRARHHELVSGYAKTARPRLMGGGRRDLVARRQDGGLFPVDVSLSPMELEEEPLIAAAVRDVTEQVRTERALRDFTNHLEERVRERTAALEGAKEDARLAERNLRQMTDSMPGAVFQLLHHDDGTQEFRFVSNGLQALLGIPPGAALHDPDTVFAAIVAEDREPVRASMAAAADAGGRWRREFRMRDREGRIRWVQGEAFPNRMDDTVVWNGFWVDVNERKLAELTLIRAKEEADNANRAKSAFLATMSHEIRTPMNVVLGLLELLAMTALDAEQTKTVRVIRGSARSLLRIIDDILDFSKIEAGHLTITPEPTSLTTLVEHVHTSFLGVARGKGLEFRRHIDPDLPTAVLVDGVRLRQILTNFVSNAVKFTAQGTVEIRAELVELERNAIRVAFRISDTGIGIPPDAQHRLFQAFVQAESNTTRKFGGTGLGLAICRRLAELMHGQIDLLSAPGSGTTVTLTLDLPVIDPRTLLDHEAPPAIAGHTVESAEDLLPLPSSRIAGSGGLAEDPAGGADEKTILIAEDHPVNSLLIIRQLAKLGLGADVVEDGREALARWREGRYRLLITDLHMPHLDGYDLAREIRRLEAATGRQPPIPIVISTANVLTTELEACRAAGIQDILTKPVSLRALTGILEKWLTHEDPVMIGTPTVWGGPVAPPVGVDLLGDMAGAEGARAATRAGGSGSQSPHWQGVAAAAAAEAGSMGGPLEMDPSATSEEIAAGPDEPLATAPIFDPSALAELSQGDREMELEILRNFLGLFPPDVAGLQQALRQRQPQGVFRLAHRLKGSCRSMGASAMGDLAEHLERAAEAGDWTTLQALEAELTAAATDLRDVVAGILAAPGPS
jgi:PAS domain S-box-containing protein